jgi:hypothetical protein
MNHKSSQSSLIGFYSNYAYLTKPYFVNPSNEDDLEWKCNVSAITYWIIQVYKLDYNILSKETCDIKSYMKSLNLPEARMKFAIRSQMTRMVQMNFKRDPGYTKNHWKCQDCFTPDTQEHIIRCPSYQHLRTGKDLSSDKDLVQYFREVLSLRDK